MFAIYKKELRTYFNTMTGYAFLGFFILVTAFYFSFLNVISGNPMYSETLSYTVTMFLILIPILTMRLFAEEAKQKTDQLLYTSPVSITQIVAGKFLASFSLFFIGVAITGLFPFMLSRFGQIPTSEILGAMFGYLLMGGCLISIGIFISVLTDNQIIAAVATFAAMFFIFMVDGIAVSMPVNTASSVTFVCAFIMLIVFIIYNSTRNIYASVIIALLGFAAVAIAYFSNNLIFDGVIVKVLSWFSILSRFDNFYMGVFNISDVVYYITFSLAFLYFTVNVIEKRRWR